MLAEFVAKIATLAQEAKSVEFHTQPSLPGVVFVRHGDQLLREDVPAARRAHTLASFADLVQALVDKAIGPAPEVYVAAGSIVALLDRAKRTERVTVPLQDSARFRLACSLQKPQSFQPKEAVKLLRYEFHDGGVEAVAEALSHVDFERTSAGRSHVEHGKESLGRAVEAKVQQAENIPKTFSVEMPIWTTAGFDGYGPSIMFGLFLDLDDSRVELRVLSDEIERARNAALLNVAADLRDRLPGVPVFLGVP